MAFPTVRSALTWTCRSISTLPISTGPRLRHPAPRFSASVSITFFGIPAGTTFPTGSFDTSTGVWTGTVAEAEALVLGLPGDYNGTIASFITVTTPEGQVTTPQVIVVDPVSDVDNWRRSHRQRKRTPRSRFCCLPFIDVQIPVDETIQTLEFSLDNLPPGTQAVDGARNPVGSFSTNPDGTAELSVRVITGPGRTHVMCAWCFRPTIRPQVRW